jgi:class 3 adenylate cyclase
MTETRKLAAILAADVVGFSRLAGADEDRTLARLRALRSDLIDPTVAVHKGRVVKRTGDGFIVDFRSVVDAVRCAVEIQNSMIERNAGLAPDRRIDYRIGVHLGDVVEESDGDLMGDGVNIAARLESVAEPGTICLSEDAYRQVRSRLDVAVSDLGQTQLKNIAEPVRVYALQVGVSVQAVPTGFAASAATAAPSPPAAIDDPSWMRRVRRARYASMTTLVIGGVLCLLATLVGDTLSVLACVGGVAIGYALVYRNIPRDLVTARLLTAIGVGSMTWFVLVNLMAGRWVYFFIEAVDVGVHIYLVWQLHRLIGMTRRRSAA